MEEAKEQKEKEIEEKTKKIKEKFKIWLSDNHNKILFVFIIFLIILKFYWFFSTLNQPLWWDEADYMNMARAYIGKGDYWKYNSWFLGSDVVRPILLPSAISLILFLGLGETAIRLLILLASIAILPLIYAVGKQFFNKEVALFSSIILGVFWSFNFYSYRILVEIPLVLLWLTTIYVFFDAYFNDKNWKHFVLAGIFLGLSFLMKFSSIILVAAITIYLITTEKLKILGNKKIIIFYVAAFLTLVPFFIYEYTIYNHPLAPFVQVAAESKVPAKVSFLYSLFYQAKYSINLLHSAFIILFYLGLIISLSYTFLLYNKIITKKETSNKYYFFLILLILSLIFFGYIVHDVGYDVALDERYYFTFYPVLFLLAGKGCSFIYDAVKKYHKILALLVVIFIIGFGAYQNIKHANQTINIKKDSYVQLKKAGEFIKENTLPEDKVMMLEEVAEISYYAERNFIHIWSDNETSILEKIKENKPKYVVLSFYISITSEDTYDIVNFIFSRPDIFVPVQAYPPYIDKEQKIPLVVVFEIQNK